VVIVDSTVWVDLFNGRLDARTAWLKRAILDQEIGLTDLILCEVLQGLRADTAFRQVKSDLMEFEIFDSGGIELAIAAAENYRMLRSNGITIRKTIDCLIATVCIQKEHVLLHNDRDFDPFERHLGLKVIHPQLLI
jgi:predicted nucleic acid-binding protein